ncbi:26795_t:CDS:2, partial [Gigaspora margarita]
GTYLTKGGAPKYDDDIPDNFDRTSIVGGKDFLTGFIFGRVWTSTLPTNWTADITPLVYIPEKFYKENILMLSTLFDSLMILDTSLLTCSTQTGKVPTNHIYVISLENGTYEWILEGVIFPLVKDPNPTTLGTKFNYVLSKIHLKINLPQNMQIKFQKNCCIFIELEILACIFGI